MRRRDFLGFATGAAAFPLLAARAQQKRLPVIGFLGGFAPSTNAQIELELAAFRQGLAETGYVEGQNVMIEYTPRPRAILIGCPHWPPTSSPAKST